MNFLRKHSIFAIETTYKIINKNKEGKTEMLDSKVLPLMFVTVLPKTA